MATVGIAADVYWALSHFTEAQVTRQESSENCVAMDAMDAMDVMDAMGCGEYSAVVPCFRRHHGGKWRRQWQDVGFVHGMSPQDCTTVTGDEAFLNKFSRQNAAFGAEVVQFLFKTISVFVEKNCSLTQFELLLSFSA